LKNRNILGIAVAASISFEVVYNYAVNNLTLHKSLYTFLFHSLILVLGIFVAINYKNISFSRIKNFKKGLIISIVFSLFISGYYYSYHKWMHPELIETKRIALIELSEKKETIVEAKKKIKLEPDYYNGKSAEDLIEMQQDNINNLLKAGKAFPISLLLFLLTGTFFTGLISQLKYLFKKIK
jgi:hypothetical protein